MPSKLYGSLPTDLGRVDISPKEFKYYQYCPVKIPGGIISIPFGLVEFEEIVYKSIEFFKSNYSSYDDQYIYLTAKTMWVSSCNPGNRPGWHSDGFMTDDVNFIWSNNNPTQFLKSKKLFPLIQDHEKSMEQMHSMVATSKVVTYPNKNLLFLDDSVIHQVNPDFKEGVRSFVKVSFSRNLYNLEGNSINPEIKITEKQKPRLETRNCPQGHQK